MTSESTTKLLTLDQVAERLNVSRRTVEDWIYNKDLASFKKGARSKKGGCPRVSEESLTRFVLLHTLNPRRPDWLTAQLESDFTLKLREIVRAEICHEREMAA